MNITAGFVGSNANGSGSKVGQCGEGEGWKVAPRLPAGRHVLLLRAETGKGLGRLV